MGGCSSLPVPDPENPAGGQPSQPGAAPVAKSLCQSIRDFFMKVTTTLSKVPQVGEDQTQNPHNRRSSSLSDIEEVVKKELTNANEGDAASIENMQKASNLFQRWELQLTELQTQKESKLRRLNEIALGLEEGASTSGTKEKEEGASTLNQFEFEENEVDPNVVRGAGTSDSAVERKNEDPSGKNKNLEIE